jgi:hypothetical protein
MKLFDFLKRKPKTFNDLVAGDTLYIWWMTGLYYFKIKSVKRLDSGIEDDYNLEITTTGMFDGDGKYTIPNHIRNFSEFVYGTDGWHEYKVYGTSCRGTKRFLRRILRRDLRELRHNTRGWLHLFKTLKRYEHSDSANN